MRANRRDQDPFVRHLARVVDTERCSGCGACAQIDARVTMTEQAGFARPVVAGVPVPTRVARDHARTFRRVCPGVVVRAHKPPHTVRHPSLGPMAGIWEAYAVDSEIRTRGSSGGVLTALAAWLAESGSAARVIGARADTEDPRRTVSVTITSRESALAAAGSRYGPVANAAHPDALDAGTAFIGKPCEASALRALGAGTSTDAPLLLSFFCAGTPNQKATDTLVTDLGVPEDSPLDDLWYRGRGWPGRFTVVPRNAPSVSASYRDSWGKALGPTVQWRCRLCADGVGEAADITAGDFWRTDGNGYPDFKEQDGISVLIARTKRGAEVVEKAVRAGMLRLEPIHPDDVALVQSYQVQRRRYLVGRLVGTLLLGRPVTRYRGFGLLSFTARSPRRTWTEFRGTVQRLRSRGAPTSHSAVTAPEEGVL